MDAHIPAPSGDPESSVRQNPVLAEHAAAIRALGKKTVENIIEIGARLTKCRSILKKDKTWRDWLNGELRLSPQTAGRFIQVHELSQTRSNLEHLDLPVSAIYLLAAPSTPETAKTEVLERAKAGEPLPVEEVKRVVDSAKGHKPRNLTRARTLREGKLGEDLVAKLKGTSLDSARELDALIRCNRGAPEGGHTEDVKKLAEAAIASKPVSAVALWKTLGPLQLAPTIARDDIGASSSGELERLTTRNQELENQVRRLEREKAALEREIEDPPTSAKEACALMGRVVAWLHNWSVADERRCSKVIQIIEHARRLIEQLARDSISDDGLDIPACLQRAPQS